MPVLAHTQQRLAVAACRNSYSSYSSTGSGRNDQLWIVQENGDHHRQKTMDFPAPRALPLRSTQKPKKPLQVDTSAKSDLHDRYLSSEEEISPSPHAKFDRVTEKSARRAMKETNNDAPFITSLEADVMTGIATIVKIMNVGKPKVIDIPRLAPMQKRRSSNPIQQTLHRAHGSVSSTYSMRSTVSSTSAYPANEAIEVHFAEEASKTPLDEISPLPLFNLPALPQADLSIAYEASLRDFPGLHIRPAPRARDYDANVLTSPQLFSHNPRTLRTRAKSRSGFAWTGGPSNDLGPAGNRIPGGRASKKGKKLTRRVDGRTAASHIAMSPFLDGDSARRMVVA